MVFGLVSWVLTYRERANGAAMQGFGRRGLPVVPGIQYQQALQKRVLYRFGWPCPCRDRTALHTGCPNAEHPDAIEAGWSAWQSNLSAGFGRPDVAGWRHRPPWGVWGRGCRGRAAARSRPYRGGRLVPSIPQASQVVVVARQTRGRRIPSRHGAHCRLDVDTVDC